MSCWNQNTVALNQSSLSLDDGLRNRESKPTAAALAAADVVTTEEALEDTRASSLAIHSLDLQK